MVHRHFLGEVARRSAAGTGDLDQIRADVMAEMRYTYFGDRIASIFAGAAPTTPEIQRFIAECFPVTYAEGYGTTEAGGSVTVRDRINRSEVLDFKLRDVPEPAPGHGTLLVEAIALGVCGTDREIIAGSYGEAPRGSERLVLGHESYGEVIAAPPGGRFAAGDRIVGIVRRPDPVPCPACAAGEWYDRSRRT